MTTSDQRLIGKKGICQLHESWHIPRNTGSYFHRFVYDSGESILNTRWRWWWMIMFLTFPSLWLTFALMYYGLARFHGDVIGHSNNHSSISCVENLRSFAGALLFSLETQERIGYGFRYSNEVCDSVLTEIPIQTVLGKIILATICGSIFARFVRPFDRAKTLLFSKTAVITHHEGSSSRCLMLRLGDVDDRQLYQLNYRLFYIDKKNNPEAMIPMRVEENGDLFLLPTLIRHEINHYSPLFSLRRHDLPKADFELVVVVEGVVETTGLTVQVRTSYLSSEIEWGYKFNPLTIHDGRDSDFTFRVQYKDFDKTSRILMSDQSVHNLTKMVPYEHRNHYFD